MCPKIGANNRMNGAKTEKCAFFDKKSAKGIASLKNSCTFASAIERDSNKMKDWCVSSVG